MWVHTVLYNVGDLISITTQGSRIPWNGYDYGVCILGLLQHHGIGIDDIEMRRVDSGSVEYWWNTPP